jgi:hypothetical protein
MRRIWPWMTRYPGVAAMAATLRSLVAEWRWSERMTCQCRRKEKKTSELCARQRWTHSPAKEMVRLLSTVIDGDGRARRLALYRCGVEYIKSWRCFGKRGRRIPVYADKSRNVGVSQTSSSNRAVNGVATFKACVNRTATPGE